MQDGKTSGSFTNAGKLPIEPNQDGHTSGRALVVLGAAALAPSARRALPCSAPFLAQLIATRLDLPATRARRRASLGMVVNLYRQTATLR